MTTYINNQVPAAPTSSASAPASAAPAAPQPTAPRRAAQPLSPFANAPAPKQTATQKAYDNDGFSLAQTMTVLGKVSQDALKTASNIQRAASQSEINAKQQGVKDTKAQVKGEQTADMVKMAGVTTGAVTAGGLGFKGAQMNLALPKPKPGQTTEQIVAAQARHKTIGSGMDAVSKTISQPIDQAFDLADKMAGGTAQADRAKVALKEDEVEGELAKANSESAKQGVQQSQEAVKNVNSVTLEHLQRWAGVYSRI